MSRTQKPIEDAIIALTKDFGDLWGEPFFHFASCELEQGFAEFLAEELSQQGYEVFVVDDYTVSWEPPPDEIHPPPVRVRRDPCKPNAAGRQLGHTATVRELRRRLRDPSFRHPHALGRHTRAFSNEGGALKTALPSA
jgi:hypothetical protein